MSSKIEWTGDTWNPIIGCDKVSAGCKNCYAIQTAWIRQHNPKMLEKYAGVVEKTANGSLNWTGKINMHEESLLKPLRNKKPTVYFVNSMSDLFHEDIPFSFIDKVFAVIGRCQYHTFQVLTKRPKRAVEYYNSIPYQRILNEAYTLNLPKNHDIGSGIDNPCSPGWEWKNLWLGVSCEDQKAADERIPMLLQVPAAVRFLSCEPLLGPIDIINGEWGAYQNGNNSPLRKRWIDGIDWVICGGESGPGARPMHPDWVRSLRDQCRQDEVPFFFKQWGNWLPFEETAQPPFYARSADKEEFDAHGMNFINNNGDPGKWAGGHWMDGFDSLMYCKDHDSSHAMFLNVGKKAAGRLLDGIEHNEFPT